MSELWELGAFELGTSIRDGVASSREVVEAHLTRIDDVNPAVNVVTTTLADEALAAADDADAVVARWRADEPFPRRADHGQGVDRPRRVARRRRA